ncbi:hypothetical protein KAR91_52020 [Candidatus Pacearchaeota archaeon]|nr:hypothetical protein [Candidatus Pacearchaeota archaeon]
MIKHKDYKIVETEEEFKAAVEKAVSGDTIYVSPDLELKYTKLEERGWFVVESGSKRGNNHSTGG